MIPHPLQDLALQQEVATPLLQRLLHRVQVNILITRLGGAIVSEGEAGMVEDDDDDKVGLVEEDN